MKKFNCELKFEREIYAEGEEQAYEIFADKISVISDYSDYIKVEEENEY